MQLYKSYVFKTKDPIIDRLRGIVADSGMSYSKIGEESGVAASTLFQWFDGKTERPRFCTVMAVTRALGYDLIVAPKTSGFRDNVVPMRRKVA